MMVLCNVQCAMLSWSMMEEDQGFLMH